MNSFRFLFLLALGVAVSAGPAAAWPYLHVTGTEVLSTEPLRVRTSFTITEVGFRPQYGEVLITPQDHATTHLYECSATPPYTCFQDANINGTLVYLELWGGPAVGSFSIVTDQLAPCVRFQFIDVLLGGTWNPVYAADINACLSEDLPVPTLAGSWGNLKATYR